MSTTFFLRQTIYFHCNFPAVFSFPLQQLDILDWDIPVSLEASCVELYITPVVIHSVLFLLPLTDTPLFLSTPWTILGVKLYFSLICFKFSPFLLSSIIRLVGYFLLRDSNWVISFSSLLFILGRIWLLFICLLM